MKHINLLPLDSHGVDFSRVRMLNLSNWSKYYRQTLLFSALQDPQINSVFNKHCFNYVGQVSSQMSWKPSFKYWCKRGGEEQKTQHMEKFHNSVAERLSVPVNSITQVFQSESPWCCMTISNAVPKAWRTTLLAAMLIWSFSFMGSCFMSEIRFCVFLILNTQVILFYLFCC